MMQKKLTTALLIIITTAAAQACSYLHNSGGKEILGLRVGMKKTDARTHLKEISEFVRSEGRNQEIWKLNDPSRFTAVVVGYREDKVRYITAFVDKDAASEHVAFSSVGDLQKAKAEIMEPHYRYIWDFPGSDTNESCSVIAYGDNPDFLTMYTLAERLDLNGSGKTEEEEDDD